MNPLASLGLILLISLLAGHLVKFARVPEVTGYILAGLALGPSGLGWIGEHNVAGLGVFSEVALGMILFSIGSIFQLEHFRQIQRTVLKITLTDAAIVFVMVSLTMLVLRQSWPASLILGVVAMETAAATTLMVMREYNTSGPFTDALTGMIAINNVLCLVAFSVLVAIIQISNAWAQSESGNSSAIYRFIYMLGWQLVGSIALGYLVGALLSSWAPKVVEHGETLILLIGCLLLAVGLAVYLELSTLITSLAIGATAANFSSHGRRLASVQARTDPPFYAIFFVIAGANMHIELLKSLGVVGAGYVLARGVAKMLGAHFGARGTDLPSGAKANIRYATLSHAGLAIGLVLGLQSRLPALAPAIATITLAAILVYELFGPVSARMAFMRSGEVRSRSPEMSEIMD